MKNPDPNPEDEAFEELSLKQGSWQYTSGWRKKQILETSMTQEALKLALEWAEAHGEIVFAGGGMDSVNKMNSWATAIKEALAQPEQKPVGDDWTPCVKLPVVVHVRKQRLGETHVSTREGITPVRLDDVIMRGVSGEEYPIGRAIFEQTYSLDTTPPQRTEQKMVMWPCLIDTADFSKGTVTIVMQCEDYKVSAGPHWLSTTRPKENT